jgi:glycosyltransferase involved in cell wall biosynthesis
MKKLLYFVSDFKIGVSALLTDQLLSIAKAGVEVVAVGGDQEQEEGLVRQIIRQGIAFKPIDGLDAHQNFRRLTSEIEKLIRDHQIDIVHVQNNWQLALVGYVRYKLLWTHRFQIVYTLHGFRHNSPIKSRIAQIFIGSALLLLADHVICMTKYLQHKFQLLSYKIDLIPLGIHDNYFIQGFVPPRMDALHLVFPAQFRMGKNHEMVIRSFADYVKLSGDDQSDVTFPGSGPLLEKMKNLALQLGVERQIHFPGQMTKEEVKVAYLDCNVAIVASNSETFGQSIVEPYVLGRAVVSTPVGIAPEIIRNDENGVLFSSQKELTNVLLRLSSNKHLIQEAGKRNFMQRDKFRWSKITELYCEKLLLK